jgi:hypothetical protein
VHAEIRDGDPGHGEVARFGAALEQPLA